MGKRGKGKERKERKKGQGRPAPPLTGARRSGSPSGSHLPLRLLIANSAGRFPQTEGRMGATRLPAGEGKGKKERRRKKQKLYFSIKRRCRGPIPRPLSPSAKPQGYGRLAGGKKGGEGDKQKRQTAISAGRPQLGRPRVKSARPHPTHYMQGREEFVGTTAGHMNASSAFRRPKLHRGKAERGRKGGKDRPVANFETRRFPAPLSAGSTRFQQRDGPKGKKKKKKRRRKGEKKKGRKALTPGPHSYLVYWVYSGVPP